VQRGPKGYFAFVVRPDQTVELRQIETGQEIQGRTLVTKGLAAGERVVIDGQLRLQPGSKVLPTEEASETPLSSRQSDATADGSKPGADGSKPGAEVSKPGTAATIR
jgi:multidrug efflux system membrane fusion protein